jgi:hypothetical protein
MPKRRSKALERIARSIKDSDEFVEHVFAIARGFHAHHELDVSSGSRGIRNALKAFDKHAEPLAKWLAQAAESASAEHEAVNALRNVSKVTLPYLDLGATQAWLRQAVRASAKAQAQLQGQKLLKAPAWAAEALRATFERHKLKVSLQVSEKKQGDAIRLFCAIAQDAGDAEMKPTQAREWLKGKS